MKKLKGEKAITLVALIITIVVLLILAVVAIGAVRDSNIIGYAQNAASDYNKEKNKEESLLSEYEIRIESAISSGESAVDWWYLEQESDGQSYKGIRYVGSNKNLVIDSKEMKAEKYIYDQNEDEPVATGQIVNINLNEINEIYFEDVETIDFRDNLSTNNSVVFGDKVKEVRGLEGVTVLDCYECNSLKYIEIPTTITNIPANCFWNCYALNDIIIPETVTSIGSYAFNCCTSLSNITIPDSVTSIEYSAFRDCTSLENITIPTGVTTISTQMFERLHKLKKHNNSR